MTSNAPSIPSAHTWDFVVEEPHSADAALILLVLNFSSKLTIAFIADEALTMNPRPNRGEQPSRSSFLPHDKELKHF